MGGADRRIAVLAAGAVGAPIGGLLTRAGHDVTLVDTWREHVEAMKASGLRLELGTRQAPEGEITVRVQAHHVSELPDLGRQFDLVFLAAKSYDTERLVGLIQPCLAADGVLVSIQNSMNEDWIAPIIGSDRTLGCLLTGGGELLGPGHAWRNRSLQHPYFTLGELDGAITARLRDVAGILGGAGRTTVTANLLGAKWTKLIHNAMGTTLSAIGGKRTWELLDIPTFLPICTRLAREGIAVGAALGYRLEPIFGVMPSAFLAAPEALAAELIRASSSGASDGSISMIQQDLDHGLPTEVTDYLNGLIVRRGRETGVPTPMNAAVVELFARVERGELPPREANLDPANLPVAISELLAAEP